MNPFGRKFAIFLCTSLFSFVVPFAVEYGSAQEPSPDSIARPLPSKWRSYFVEEPVLGSTMRVARAGHHGKPPLVLVHGLGQNGLMDWEAIIELMKDRYYIIAPDLPGFGQSSVSSGRLSPANFAAVLHWLIDSEELDDVHLVGHSMGGAVALYYAARYPDRVAKLSLINAAGILHRAALVKSMAEVDERNYSFLPEFLQRPVARMMNFGNRMVESINLWPDVTRPLQKNDLAWGYVMGDQPNGNAALSLINTDYSQIVNAINVPTHIIWGARDPIAPLRTAFLLDGLISPSNLHIIADAEHVPIKSHSGAVAAFLEDPVSPETVSRPQLAAGPEEEKEWPVLTCRGRTGQRYSGRYSHIVLHNCLDTSLVDVWAESVEMRNSEAEFIDLRITGNKDTAFRLDRSSAVMTDAEITGNVAVELNSSRLDMAGVRLNAIGTAIEFKAASVLIASVSEVISPLYEGKLHGAVRAKNVRGEALSELRSREVPLHQAPPTE